MSIRTSSFIVLRSVIEFGDGPLADIDVNWIQTVIATRNGTRNINFEPVRQRDSDLAEEWYVYSDVDLMVHFFPRFSERDTPFSIPRFRLESPLRIVVAEAEPTVTNRDRFLIVGGSIHIPLGTLFNTRWRRQISDLWPTGNFRDITDVHLEPSGVHIQGSLPSGFYHDGAQVPVVLRVPREPADFMRPEDTRQRPELANRNIWRLTSHSFEGVDEESRSIVSKSVQSMPDFQLPTEIDRKAQNFIDSARISPGEDCVVGVFSMDRSVSSVQRLDWLAGEINTSLNLGGSGTTEATFVPDSLYGTLVESSDGTPINRIVRLESRAETESDKKFTLRIVEDGSVNAQATEGTVDMRAIVQPVSPINQARDGVNESRFRSWLCTSTGWTAFDSVHDSASIDPDKVKPGPLLGVLEMGRLITKLKQGTSGRSGLAVQMQSLGSGGVAIALEEPAGSIRSLTLTIADPMTTLVTPPVFYRVPEIDSGNQDTGTLQSAVPSLTSGIGLVENIEEDQFTAQLQELDRTITRRFESVTFVSKNVTKDFVKNSEGDLVHIRTLETEIDFSGALDDQLALNFDAASTTLWHRPAQLPIVRNFPWPSNQDVDAFIDANRGLLPFVLRVGGEFVEFKFPEMELPRTSFVPDLSEIMSGTGDWTLHPRATMSCAFLPTLPGVELATNENPPIWQYRHAVPVLDEAYGEAAESPDASRGQSPLPDGFDPTRVTGTVAFQLGDATIDGLLHPTDANQQGQLSLSVTASDFLGLEPTLALQISNPGGGETQNRILSRQQNVAGLHLPIVVSPRTGSDLPSFEVQLGETAGTGSHLDSIRRSGQPLLGELDAASGHVRTQDGVGMIWEQSASALQRSRRVGNDALSVRLAESININNELVLNMLGVDIIDETLIPPSVASDTRAQTWALRSSEGTHARIAGFPLRPIRLITPIRSTSGLSVSVEAVLLHRVSEVDDEGIGQVVLTFEKLVGGLWALKEIEGSIDWRFPVPASGFSEVALTRLTGTILSGQDDPASVQLNIEQLELDSPTGFIEFNINRLGTIAAGVLSVPDGGPVTLPTTAGFAAFVGPFTVNEGDPASPLLTSTDLYWTRVDGSSNLRSNLALHSGLWSLKLTETSGDSLLVDLDLTALPSTPGQILFETRDGSLTLTTNPDCWFKRSSSDFGLIAIEFRKSTEIEFLSGEILVQLVGRDANPNVQAQLGVSLSLNVESQISLKPSVSGEITLRNHIGLERDGALGEHLITLVVDRSQWPVESIFFGRGPQTPKSVHAIAHHRLAIGDSETSWTVPQPVRLRTATNYSEIYLTTSLDDDSLIVDAGWAFLLGLPGESGDIGSTTRGTLELQIPRMNSGWRLRTLPESEIGFGNRLSHVVRLPFACAGSDPAVSLPVMLVDDSATAVEMVLPDSGAQLPQFAPKQLPLLSPDVVTFVRRGPLAYWFDVEYLGDLYTEFDDELLPAFENGVISNRIPGSFSDLGWLQQNGTTINGRLRAASFRTSYVPRGEPVALDSSAVVSFPYLLSQDSPGAPIDDRSTTLQLMANDNRKLARITRQHIETNSDPGSAALEWARNELAARRRDQAALILKDYEAVIPVHREFSNGRRERPQWPDAPILQESNGVNGHPPTAQMDRRRILPEGIQCLEPAPKSSLTCFAARPEPAENEPAIKAVAATRFRLANESGGVLQNAAATTATLDFVEQSARVIGGALQSMTKSEDVAFEVSDVRSHPSDWDRFPNSGSEVWALRAAAPGPSPGSDLATPPGPHSLQTLEVPLIDIVVWARRPGESSRSTIFSETTDFASPDAPVAFTSLPGEFTLRRPRAAAGPDEAVRLDVVHNGRIVRGTLEYGRLRIEQRIARTPIPDPGDIYAVLSSKSEIFESSANKDEAEKIPALVRIRGGEVEESNLTLIADELFIPQSIPTGASKIKSILIINGDGSIPAIDPVTPHPDSVRFDSDGLRDAIIESDFVPVGDHTKQLLINPSKLASLHSLLTTGGGVAVLQLLQYFRDDPGHDWTAPENPLAALFVVALDATREFVKPKMGLAILHGRTFADPQNFNLAGYGRLEDDDFAPVRAQPSGDRQIAWTRTANIQTLDRVDEFNLPNYVYDVVLYGPGGELIPTER